MSVAGPSIRPSELPSTDAPGAQPATPGLGDRARLRLSEEAVGLLRCPISRGQLARGGDGLHCLDAGCGTSFPIIDGIPVLINEARSIFSIADFRHQKTTTFRATFHLEQAVARYLPDISWNPVAARNYRALARRLLARTSRPRVLVVGGSLLGKGMESLADYPEIEYVETDVSFGPRTGLICDGHDLPFADRSFDAVVFQAVLEHVVDPTRCVEEAHRVLADAGLVYAETPFMQQVHCGRFDFTRFTDLGHRRLFRAFEQIESGITCGPGMAAAWAYRYLLLSLARGPATRTMLGLFARTTAFWLKYLDRFLVSRPGAYDAASGFYFLGQKSDVVLSDRALIAQYRGAQ
jgi:SAM-dependent methyltransferase